MSSLVAPRCAVLDTTTTRPSGASAPTDGCQLRAFSSKGSSSPVRASDSTAAILRHFFRLFQHFFRISPPFSEFAFAPQLIRSLLQDLLRPCSW